MMLTLSGILFPTYPHIFHILTHIPYNHVCPIYLIYPIYPHISTYTPCVPMYLVCPCISTFIPSIHLYSCTHLQLHISPYISIQPHGWFPLPSCHCSDVTFSVKFTLAILFKTTIHPHSPSTQNPLHPALLFLFPPFNMLYNGHYYFNLLSTCHTPTSIEYE